MLKTCPDCNVTWEPAKGTPSRRIASDLCKNCDSGWEETKKICAPKPVEKLPEKPATKLSEMRVVGVKASTKMTREEFLQRYVLNQCNANAQWDGKILAENALACWNAIQ
jgi:hypothetical protein